MGLNCLTNFYIPLGVRFNLRVQRLNRTERDIMEIRGHRGGVRSYVPVEVALTTVNCWVETGFGSRRASGRSIFNRSSSS